MDEPHIVKSHGLFGNVCRVEVTIHASPARVWRILTDAKGYPRWNSTVDEAEGDVREGGRITLHVRGAKHTDTATVSGVVPNERMTWSGGVSPVFRDVRNFNLAPADDGSTEFSMEERFSGLLVPLVEGTDFAPIFERYAYDLKREAERGTSTSSPA